MTASANTTENVTTVTVTDNDGNDLTVNLDSVTDLVVKLLAARKDGYAAQRTARQAARQAKRDELAAAKVARTEAKAAKTAARRTKLEAQLAALSA